MFKKCQLGVPICAHPKLELQLINGCQVGGPIWGLCHLNVYVLIILLFCYLYSLLVDFAWFPCYLLIFSLWYPSSLGLSETISPTSTLFPPQILLTKFHWVCWWNFINKGKHEIVLCFTSLNFLLLRRTLSSYF